VSIVFQGIIHGTTIELNEPPGVADGQKVEVTVRVVEPQRKWGDGIIRSAGIAAGELGVDEAFAQIQRERKAAKFRDLPS
jgi:hypothetical protein